MAKQRTGRQGALDREIVSTADEWDTSDTEAHTVSEQGCTGGAPQLGTVDQK